MYICTRVFNNNDDFFFPLGNCDSYEMEAVRRSSPICPPSVLCLTYRVVVAELRRVLRGAMGPALSRPDREPAADHGHGRARPTRSLVHRLAPLHPPPIHRRPASVGIPWLTNPRTIFIAEDKLVKLGSHG